MTKTRWATTWQNQQNECAPSEDSDQPGHSPSLFRVFAVRSMGSWGPNVSSCGQQRLWSDWADGQADLSLCWAHSHIAGFLVRQLNCEVLTGPVQQLSTTHRRLFWADSWDYGIFVLHKLILQTRMHSHPVGLDVWFFFVKLFIYFHTLCVQTAKALARLRACAGSPEHSVVAYVASAIISWAGSFNLPSCTNGCEAHREFLMVVKSLCGYAACLKIESFIAVMFRVLLNFAHNAQTCSPKIVLWIHKLLTIQYCIVLYIIQVWFFHLH